MNQHTIINATVQDAETIAQLARELAEYEGEASAASADSIAQALSPGSQPRCYGLLVGQEDVAGPIGFALYYAGYDLSSASYGFHLADIYMREAHRNQGGGTQLLSAIVRHANEQGRRWISLTALKGNDAARRFYRAHGFDRPRADFYAIGRAGMQEILRKTANDSLD